MGTKKKKFKRKNNDHIFIQVWVSPIQNDQILRLITPSELHTLLAICSHMDANGRGYPSISRLAALTGRSKSTINRNIKSLNTKEFDSKPILKIGKIRKNEGDFYSNHYEVNQSFGFTIFENKQNKQKSETQKRDTNYNQDTNENQKNNNNHKGILLEEKVVTVPTTENDLRVQEGPQSIGNIINENQSLSIKIKNVSELLVKQDDTFEGDMKRAAGAIRKHCKEMGEETWLKLYKDYERNPKGIAFYSFMTYKILRQGKTYKVASKEWDAEQ